MSAPLTCAKAPAQPLKKPRAKTRSLDKPKDVAAFKAWLTASGADVLAPTNPYEVVRFRGSTGVSVVYRNERKRRHSLTGQAGEAWSSFAAGTAMDLNQPPPAYIASPETRRPALSRAALLEHAAEAPLTIAFVMAQNEMPMRAAQAVLFDMERDGLLIRSGGDRGGAMLWSLPPMRTGDPVLIARSPTHSPSTPGARTR